MFACEQLQRREQEKVGCRHPWGAGPFYWKRPGVTATERAQDIPSAGAAGRCPERPFQTFGTDRLGFCFCLCFRFSPSTKQLSMEKRMTPTMEKTEARIPSGST